MVARGRASGRARAAHCWLPPCSLRPPAPLMRNCIALRDLRAYPCFGGVTLRNYEIRLTTICKAIEKSQWLQTAWNPHPQPQLQLTRPVTDSNWMRVAEDRSQWRAIGEAYVQQWTKIDR
ncbi:hypothetical protein MSG28_000295 [Choristoneura fumiferana]|uniref:Uncharacterized protein n=1 Tax=Choristoneura fumiferana TaxID=7141 RepID=A0ACC0K004_CHOFU|nr:hypothetical protein MSG28_000295 [Choristoneura fumiferana]